MKKNIILFSITFLFYISTFSQSSKLRVRELNYGISKASKLYSTELKSSPSGTLNTTEKTLKIFKKTNTIPAALNTQFGVEYELISKSDQTLPLEITWIFPKAIKDKTGKRLTKLSYQIMKFTNTYTYENYTLEKENEIVKGQWILIIKKSGKELYRKKFILI